ncbi:hypothetical protein DBR37_07115 [Herminiimonas sp. KBW02]|uniref:HisA/HisF-related TIM barrel protein n=1 Tax=Herminiimonas sp. KBW02 TaxID=2153363 RepID=UPI000F5A311C|nr:HisA/HisF-related TIM barrel protein [Herminiimonas sp. KBW02]RQO36093.1 hypothetical protein DBR37_07115 [Herminiimonas sp. KBW02]
MLKKRLIGVVTVKNGWAVQSFGYKRYLPLGKPECLIENLDRWGADEILVQVIDRSIDKLGPDFSLLEKIGRLGLETPLIYSGGIRSANDGVAAVQLGADRLVLDALLHDDHECIAELSHKLGAQALVAALPLSLLNGELRWLDYRTHTSSAISDKVLNLLQTGVVSEILIVDWLNEGGCGVFNTALLDTFPSQQLPLIAFGGIAGPTHIESILERASTMAIAIGNSLSYREHAIQKCKEALLGMPLRSPHYESKYPLLAHA